jgi:hypothetical protein
MVFQRGKSDEFGASSVEVADLPCLRGGHVLKPIPLPVEHVDGRDAVALCAFEPWVNWALTGAYRGDCAAVVATFIEEVHQELNGVGEGIAGVVPAGGSCSGGHASQAPRARDKLGLSDSDDEAANDVDGGVALKRGRRKLVCTWTTVRIEGEELTVRRRRRGKGLLLPLRGPGLLAVVSILRRRVQESADQEAEPSTPPPKRQRAVREMVHLEAMDKGRIVWLVRNQHWQVIYQDEEQKERRTTSKLGVPKLDVCGQPLASQKQEKIRRQLLAQARSRWNELDRSGAPRYSADMLAY